MSIEFLSIGELIEPVSEFTTKFSKSLVDELRSRDIEFYLYLIPPALFPWITSKIIPDPSFKSYLDIVVISLYTTVLWDITSD